MNAVVVTDTVAGIEEVMSPSGCTNESWVAMVASMVLWMPVAMATVLMSSNLCCMMMAMMLPTVAPLTGRRTELTAVGMVRRDAVKKAFLTSFAKVTRMTKKLIGRMSLERARAEDFVLSKSVSARPRVTGRRVMTSRMAMWS